MKTTVLYVVAAAMLGRTPSAQESKPVPKDSVRVSVPGCSKDLLFTAGPRTEDQPGRSDIPEGTRFRMNGPKAMMKEIKAQEGSTIAITGLIKKGQTAQDGVALGGGVRVRQGPSPSGGLLRDPSVSQVVIDIEGWRLAVGRCPAH